MNAQMIKYLHSILLWFGSNIHKYKVYENIIFGITQRLGRVLQIRFIRTVLNCLETKMGSVSGLFEC